jgi:tetratricopeptide (TPR) repeat protein
VLLLLDNYEHLMAGATLTSKLLEACPNLKLLVTSRERLNVEEEWVLSLDGLTVPTTTSLTEAERFDALNLFIQRAKRATLGFSLTQETLPHALKICQLVEGSPLGIELAAVWVKSLPLSEIAKEIETNLSILEAPTKNIAERHQSIRAAFEHSWKLLTDKEQEVLRKLSVFVGGFRREAAAEIARATLPILAGLVDKALLWIADDGRYSQHFLLYQFCQEKLDKYDYEKIDSRNKHEEFYFDFIEASGKELWGSTSREILKVMDEEIENVQTAWYWAAEGTKVEKLQQASELVLYYDSRTRFKQGIDIFEQAVKKLDIEKVKHHAALGTLLVQQGWLYHRLGKYETVNTLVQKGITLLRPLNMNRLIAIGLNAMGISAKQMGDFIKAKACFEEGLEIARSLGEKVRTAPYLNNLMLVETALGNYEKARQYNDKALEIYTQHNNLFGTTIALNYLGELLLITNHLEKAKTILHESWQLGEQIKFQLQIPHLITALGVAEHKLGNMEIAQNLFWKAMKAIQENQDPSLEAKLWINLGRISTETSNYSDAESYLRNAMKTAWAAQDKPLALCCLVHFSKLRIKQGKLTEANEWLNLALNHPAAYHHDRVLSRQLLEELAICSIGIMTSHETRPLESVVLEAFPWALTQA